jgi:two-component system cell cycle sensor histidine kinase PleC
MSKIEAGRMTLAQDPVELDGILDETCRIISHAAEEKSLHVVTEVEPGLAFVGDRRAMKQVILNLFSNAVKFTPEGGRVSLAAKTAEREVVVTISDTGIGIPQDRIATLGRPFVQVENQFTKSHKGSGLGLAIARSLIELQGGQMDIASEPGQGTTVTLRLPIERSDVPTGEVDAAA